MISERLLSSVVRSMNERYLALDKTDETMLPGPVPGQRYMLYMHVPFCESLCPYCSFNRFPFSEERARPYFEHMRREMLMLAEMGYDFESLYIGGGTPTIMMDELVKTIELARGTFHIKDVSSETNPNHLVPEYLEKLVGNVQRLSVGVQSFDNGLLKQMNRYDKYGSAEEIFDRINSVEGLFDALNVDMIFNFPSQTEDMLINDVAAILESSCTQTTFYPLMASRSVEKSLKDTVGQVSYDREKRFYEIISEGLTGGPDPKFTFGSAWTFNTAHQNMIDEYIVDYEEYPAIGSGSIAHLDGFLYVNSFSIKEYNDAIAAGHLPVMGKTKLTKHDLMRYHFLLQLYSLRLDKREFKERFGCSVETGLPMEMAFMRANRSFATDNGEELTLTPKGRYLTVVMYRQFLSGMNNLRDQARDALSGSEHELLFGAGEPA